MSRAATAVGLAPGGSETSVVATDVNPDGAGPKAAVPGRVQISEAPMEEGSTAMPATCQCRSGWSTARLEPTDRPSADARAGEMSTWPPVWGAWPETWCTMPAAKGLA
ncbi:MAG: hypothetical protein ACRDX8_05095 [Acidimicrobiales bacterium]